MLTETTVAGLRAVLQAHRRAGRRIGFVPTMGNLHAGHISLIARARAECDVVVSSIFVNPTQFGANEDFASYPRTLAEDSHLLAEAHCDVLFAPDVTEMYPNGRDQFTTVSVAGMSDLLCGEFRPGHFTGVATVVSKLFNLVQPDVAYFGEKDFQQLAVIRIFTRELAFPVEIVGVPTARAEDGLALSSRNGYLSASERQQAPMIYKTLCQVRDAINGGLRDYRMLEDASRLHLQKSGFVPDYLAICRRDDLQPATEADRELVILVAARLGRTRLIDNLCLSLPV